MKKFAFYLPQYHEIKENNEWWGEGFTEWVNVKKASPLYKNHSQPKKPLDSNYYVLDNPDILKWQANLAKMNCIDGMIFYHYYFKGKKLLEKPVEILLNNKDIPMNFFFCWANHSWYRSWEGSKKVLISQEYGDKTDWEVHFQYLISYFKDTRYLKINNKPVLMIYISEFPEKEEIVTYFNQRCKESGFAGIQIIDVYMNYSKTRLDSDSIAFYREPNCSYNSYKSSLSVLPKRVLNKCGKILYKKIGFKYVEIFDGNKLLNLASKKHMDGLRGLFFEWDNTPRHGYRGYIITPPSKETFMKYMDSIKDSEYVFINAWNEWAEGMMLEPTEENGYKYLEWIKEWSEKNENRTDGI